MNCKHKYRLFWLIILLFIFNGTSGQSMLGLTFSIYSGVSGAMVNPAFLTGSKVFVDINAVGNINFIQNDIYYVPASENFLSQIIRFDTAQIKNGDFKYSRNYTYFNNTKDKFFYGNVKVLGPAVMIQAGKHAFAISSFFRSVHSGNNIPYEVPIIMYEEISYEPYQDINFNEKNYSFVTMTWSEINLSYAYDIFDQYENRLTFGATVKGLFGHEGGYASIKNANFIIHDRKTVQFNNLNAEFGYSLPVDYETSEILLEPLTKGYGFGVDLGFVFTKKSSSISPYNEKKLCAKPYSDYKYRIGVSLIDIGSITFRKNAEKHVFDNVGLYWEEFDTVHYDGINRIVESYDQAFYGDTGTSYVSDKIKIALPTTVSFQFDYHIHKDFYFAAIWSQPVKYQPNQIYQPSLIAVIPRYETRMIGVSVPVSLFNYQKPAIGLALRVYSFTIGTENLGSWLGLSDFTGTDFYFSLKINLNKGFCLSYRKGACSNRYK